MNTQELLGGRLSAFEEILRDATLPRTYWESRWDFLQRNVELVLPEQIVLPFFIPDVTTLSRSQKKALGNIMGERALRLAAKAQGLMKQPERLNRFRDRISQSDPEADVIALALLLITFAIYRKELTKASIRAHCTAWVAIADQCGRWRLRYVLEDTIFRFLEPKNYTLILSVLKKNKKQYQSILDETIVIVRHHCKLRKVRLTDIYARRKNVYGIYAKMLKDKKGINQVRDFFGIRIIVPTVADCYNVLSVIHGLWPHYPEYLKDFIRIPKANGYRSLHTTVCCLKKQDVDFQIRTEEMHSAAQFGVASHATYKAESRVHH